MKREIIDGRHTKIGKLYVPILYIYALEEHIEELEKRVKEEIKITNAQAEIALEKDQLYWDENAKVRVLGEQIKELESYITHIPAGICSCGLDNLLTPKK